jgi:hypothetical protein
LCHLIKQYSFNQGENPNSNSHGILYNQSAPFGNNGPSFVHPQQQFPTSTSASNPNDEENTIFLKVAIKDGKAPLRFKMKKVMLE